MGSSNVWDGALDRVQYEPARQAALSLIYGLSQAGLSITPKTGVTAFIQFHDEYGRYLLAFICNRTDLLFYVRRPAIYAMPTLPGQARERFRDVSANTADECKIRIYALDDAENLLSWLVPLLPLPFPLKPKK
ncbi:MAG: hypothetical protein EON58_00350 [Alphaproteobacteria bacterium]|nr:MAG: hypothetical protein EON58_00350 [Alphaproteobacteria bacterium]